MGGNAPDTEPDTAAARNAGGSRPGWRRRVWALLEDHTSSSNRIGAYAVEIALAGVILINCAALMLWTVPGLRESYAFWFQFSEYANHHRFCRRIRAAGVDFAGSQSAEPRLAAAVAVCALHGGAG